jgi:hypothetical protein
MLCDTGRLLPMLSFCLFQAAIVFEHSLIVCRRPSFVRLPFAFLFFALSSQLLAVLLSLLVIFNSYCLRSSSVSFSCSSCRFSPSRT